MSCTLYPLFIKNRITRSRRSGNSEARRWTNSFKASRTTSRDTASTAIWARDMGIPLDRSPATTRYGPHFLCSTCTLTYASMYRSSDMKSSFIISRIACSDSPSEPPQRRIFFLASNVDRSCIEHHFLNRPSHSSIAIVSICSKIA